MDILKSGYPPGFFEMWRFWALIPEPSEPLQMEKSLEKSCWKSKKICSNGWWENEKDRPKEPSFTIIYPCSANPWNFKYTWIWYDIYDQCLKAEYLCLPISSRDQSGVGRFLCYQSQDLEVLETALNERDAASASMDVLGGVHFSQQFTDLSCLCLKRSIDIKKDHNNKYLYLSCIETYSLQRIRTLLAALVGVIMHVFFLNTSHRLHRRPHCRKKRKSRPVKIMGQEPPKSLCNVASFLPKTSVVTLW